MSYRNNFAEDNDSYLSSCGISLGFLTKLYLIWFEMYQIWRDVSMV